MSAYDIAVMVGGPLFIVCGVPWIVQRAIATQDRQDHDRPSAPSEPTV
jgi:hypothetical protein